MSRRGPKNRRSTAAAVLNTSYNGGECSSKKKQTTLSMFTKKHSKRKSSSKKYVANISTNNVNAVASSLIFPLSRGAADVDDDDAVMENVADQFSDVKRGDFVDYSASFAFRCDGDVNSSDDGDIWRRGQQQQTISSSGNVVCHNDHRSDVNKNVFAFRNTSTFSQTDPCPNNNYAPSRSTFGFVQPLSSSNPYCIPSVSQSPTSSVKRRLVKPPSFRVAPPLNIRQLKYRDGAVPLPKILWADENDVWNLMCWKDTVYIRNPHLLQQHSTLQPKMRAILIDWLSEVCEVYKLHRETFHLAIDFVDRFLSKEKNVPKAKLQLIGITSLFIAAKLEEIYPPKCSDFAYVTDGACSADDISSTELYILKVLNWALAPITAIHWLTVYLQIINQHEKPFQFNRNRLPRDFAFARYHRYQLVQLAPLIDLCLMDAGSLQFSYSILAACAFAHILEPQHLSLHVSGFKFEDIATCFQWMTPFAKATQERGETQMKHLVDISDDDMHNIQTHVVDLDLLEKSHAIQLDMKKTSRMSPVFLQDSLNILPTPPPSDERPSLCVSRLPPYKLQQ